jgi:uncharacterized membrane protein YgaE (UPF0421/DUF939 family)
MIANSDSVQPITNLISSNVIGGGRGVMTEVEIIYPPAHNHVAIMVTIVVGIAIFAAWIWFSRRKNLN